MSIGEVVVVTSTENTAYCTKCGAKLSSDSAFCIECGARTKLEKQASGPLFPSSRPTEQASTVKRSSPAGMLFGVLLSLGFSVLFPYLYSIGVKSLLGFNAGWNPTSWAPLRTLLEQYLQMLKLDPIVSMASVFILSLLTTFSFLGLRPRKT